MELATWVTLLWGDWDMDNRAEPVLAALLPADEVKHRSARAAMSQNCLQGKGTRDCSSLPLSLPRHFLPSLFLSGVLR